MNTKIAWHYTGLDTFRKILECGELKSRALLVSEKLQARSDWDSIKDSREAIESALPDYMTDECSFLAHAPIIFFSRQQHWEPEAGRFNESKSWSEGGPEGDHLEMMELYRRTGGIIRLGLPEDRLLGWHELQIASGVPVKSQVIGHIFGWFLDNRRTSCLMHFAEQYLPLAQLEYDRTFLMGVPAASLKLSQTERAEVFLPDDPDAEDGKGIWMPLPWPLPLPLDRFLPFIEAMRGHLEEAQKSLRIGPSDITKREDLSVTSQIV